MPRVSGRLATRLTRSLLGQLDRGDKPGRLDGEYRTLQLLEHGFSGIADE